MVGVLDGLVLGMQVALEKGLVTESFIGGALRLSRSTVRLKGEDLEGFKLKGLEVRKVELLSFPSLPLFANQIEE